MTITEITMIHCCRFMAAASLGQFIQLTATCQLTRFIIILLANSARITMIVGFEFNFFKIHAY